MLPLWSRRGSVGAVSSARGRSAGPGLCEFGATWGMCVFPLDLPRRLPLPALIFSREVVGYLLATCCCRQVMAQGLQRCVPLPLSTSDLGPGALQGHPFNEALMDTTWQAGVTGSEPQACAGPCGLGAA